jgi:hypothetical protein
MVTTERIDNAATCAAIASDAVAPQATSSTGNPGVDTTSAMPPALADVLREYSDVFADLPPGLPPARGVTHAVRVEPNSVPPARRAYRPTHAELAEMNRQIADLYAKGFIEPACSPYAAPVLFVQKKDGSLRMCVDYRMLNKITIKDKYPLPRIDELFDSLAGKCIFSSLDLQSGYHQVRITPEDVPKTAFVTPYGQYQFKVLCFGLSNAPATFQRMMDQVFHDIKGKSVLIYLDDILVMSNSMEEHVEHVREVLARLRKHQFYAKASKCTFAQPQIKFLGHIVSARGLEVDGEKVEVVRKWPHPKNLGELRSFLGLANYFRKFVRGYSTVVAPLTDLTNGAPFNYGEWPAGREREAFEHVKELLTTPPVLALPDPDKPYQVRTDASIEGTGAVLLQDDRPIAYASRKFTPAERNYSTFDQEMLALYHAWKEHASAQIHSSVERLGS